MKDKNHWLTQACNIIFNFKNLKDLEVEFMDDSQGFTTCIRSNIKLWPTQFKTINVLGMLEAT